MMRAWVKGMRPSLLLFIWCASLVPLLLALLPFAAAVAPDLMHQPKGQELWHDDSYVFDLMEVISKQRATLSAVAAVSLIVALLLGPAVSGAIVASLRGERIIAGAARDYGRQLRLALFGALPLLLAGALGAPAFMWLNKYADRAVRETPVDQAQLGASVLAAVFVLLAFAWVECGRAAMVKATERIGAWRAFASGTRYFFRHFLRVVVAFTLPVALSLALALAIMAWRAHSQCLWLAQLVPFLFAWARTARLAAIRL